MSTTKISRRYAVALFELIQEGVDVRPALQSAAAFVANDEAAVVLNSPVYPDDIKVAVLTKAASGKGSEEVARLASLLCGRNKALLLPEIAGQVDEMIRQADSAVDAEITSAVDLSADAQAALASSLESAIGKKVQIVANKDESIVGGVVIRLGDRKIDCSVKGKLDGMKRAIIS